MAQFASKGIIGTKLGMTQLFDEESGRVTPVTVIEAGPCPVAAVRTQDVDGYTAVQIAYGEVKPRKLDASPRPATWRPPGSARTSIWWNCAESKDSPSARV